MSALHIYVEKAQPLTRYVDDVSGHRFVVTHSPRTQFVCHTCGRRRWAKNLSIQVYYDSVHIFCTEKVYRRASTFPFGYGWNCPMETA